MGYFLYIFIIYFSTYGIYLLIIKFKGKLNYVFAISFVIIFFLIYRINLYHPYQSLYFNLIVPSSIKKNVDVDYTGLSGYHFLKDLSKRIEDNQLATSILLFSIKISVSLINSEAIIG